MINFNEAGGQVRLLIGDVDEANLILDANTLNGYLAGYGLFSTDPVLPRQPILRAAADALDAIATSEALVSKVMQTVDGLQTDGAKVANSLRTRADSLRRQADALDDVEPAGPPDAYFGVVPYVPVDVPCEAAERPIW